MISSTRQTGQGINPITLSEIGWYSKLFDFKFHPWEIKALLKIDEVARKAWSNPARNNTASNATLLKDRVSGGKQKVFKKVSNG